MSAVFLESSSDGSKLENSTVYVRHLRRKSGKLNISFGDDSIDEQNVLWAGYDVDGTKF